MNWLSCDRPSAREAAGVRGGGENPSLTLRMGKHPGESDALVGTPTLVVVVHTKS